jgi:hypothetical protein
MHFQFAGCRACSVFSVLFWDEFLSLDDQKVFSVTHTKDFYFLKKSVKSC